jgi:hypothetical protein
MKNLINFKKFSLNESDQIEKSINNISDSALDIIIDKCESDALLAIKENVPYLYQVLSKRSQSRGIDIDKMVSAKAKMKWI